MNNQNANDNANLQKLYDLLSKKYYKPDFQAIRVVLGVIQSHRLNLGDPAWIFVVAPAGSGKTTTSIMGTCGLPEVIMLGDLTEKTFISGFNGHDRPGILEKLGHTVKDGHLQLTKGDGILVAKDFTTVLSMRREKRAEILSQLREIHDGQFKRDFGTGVSKVWSGRVTMIAAVTPILDRHYGVFTTLGERFLQVRWHRPDSEEAGVWAIQQQGGEEEFQKELRSTILGIFDGALKNAPVMPESMLHRIASIAEIVAIGRTHIFRSSFGNRDIEYTPEPEANTRISKGLAALAKGIAALSGHSSVTESDLQDAFRVALDAIPDARKRLLLACSRGEDINLSTDFPRTTLQRHIEELAELQLIKKEESGQYHLTSKIERLLLTADVSSPNVFA